MSQLIVLSNLEHFLLVFRLMTSSRWPVWLAGADQARKTMVEDEVKMVTKEHGRKRQIK